MLNFFQKASLRGRMNAESRKLSLRMTNSSSSNAGENAPLLSQQRTNNSTLSHVATVGDDTPNGLWTNEDPRPWVSYPVGFFRLTWLVLTNNPINVLLVFVPLGIVAGLLSWSPVAVFALNFMAIIPLAALLSFATEELSAELGQTIGGLMNASFGNAVELIVAIMALIRNEIVIVQTGMLGSILSNILLVSLTLLKLLISGFLNGLTES
jgi:Ca2+:H+ antiporter